jgi:hypothetical protein
MGEATVQVDTIARTTIVLTTVMVRFWGSAAEGRGGKGARHFIEGRGIRLVGGFASWGGRGGEVCGG